MSAKKPKASPRRAPAVTKKRPAKAAAPARPAPTPPADALGRMKRYVLDIAAGRLFVAEATRQAAARHLRDIEASKSEAFPFYFDEGQAARALRFVALLRHVKGDIAGQRLELHEWATFFLASIFGWRVKGTGTRRFREAIAWVPRGNSKSTILSAASLYAAFAEGGQADCYSLATTKEQAGICWGDAAQMLRASPDVMAALGIEVYKTTLLQPRTNSSFRRLASRDTTLDGLNVSWSVIDELHEIPRALWDVIKTALGKRANSILVSISTAGMDSGSFGREQYRYCRQVLSGEVKDETTFALIYECPEGADPYSEKAQRAANPMFGQSVRPEILAAAADKARRFSGSRASYLVKHMNVWQSARESFFDMAKWDAGADPRLRPEDFAGDPCNIGLDLASRHAFACAAKLFWRDLPHRDQKMAALGEVERHYYLFVDAYLNEDAVVNSATDAYRAWVGEGWITQTPGNITDYGWIRRDLAAALVQLDVREIVSDPYEAEQLRQSLGAPENFIVYPQTVPNLSPALKEMQALVLSGRLHHNANPVMRWMVGNVTAREDANENVFPRKDAKESYIDGVSATLNAIGRAMAGDVQGEGGSYLDTEGLVML